MNNKHYIIPTKMSKNSNSESIHLATPYRWMFEGQKEASDPALMSTGVVMNLVNISSKLEEHQYPSPSTMLMSTSEEGWTHLHITVHNQGPAISIQALDQKELEQGLKYTFNFYIGGKHAEGILSQLELESVKKNKNKDQLNEGEELKNDWLIASPAEHAKNNLHLQLTKGSYTLATHEVLHLTFKNIKIEIDDSHTIDANLHLHYDEGDTAIWPGPLPVFKPDIKNPPLRVDINLTYEAQTDTPLKDENMDALYLSKDPWEVPNLLSLTLTFIDQFNNKKLEWRDANHSSNFELHLNYVKDSNNAMVRQEDLSKIHIGYTDTEGKDWDVSPKPSEDSPIFWVFNPASSPFLVKEEFLTFNIKNIYSFVDGKFTFLELHYRNIKGYKDSIIYIPIKKKIPPTQVVKFEAFPERILKDNQTTISWQCIGPTEEDSWKIVSADYKRYFKKKHIGLKYKDTITFELKNAFIHSDDSIDLKIQPENGTFKETETATTSIRPCLSYATSLTLEEEHKQASYILLDSIYFNYQLEGYFVFPHGILWCEEYPQIYQRLDISKDIISFKLTPDIVTNEARELHFILMPWTLKKEVTKDALIKQKNHCTHLEKKIVTVQQKSIYIEDFSIYPSYIDDMVCYNFYWKNEYCKNFKLLEKTSGKEYEVKGKSGTVNHEALRFLMFDRFPDNIPLTFELSATGLENVKATQKLYPPYMSKIMNLSGKGHFFFRFYFLMGPDRYFNADGEEATVVHFLERSSSVYHSYPIWFKDRDRFYPHPPKTVFDLVRDEAGEWTVKVIDQDYTVSLQSDNAGLKVDLTFKNKDPNDILYLLSTYYNDRKEEEYEILEFFKTL